MIVYLFQDDANETYETYETVKKLHPMETKVDGELQEVVKASCNYETFLILEKIGLIDEGADGLLDFLYGLRYFGSGALGVSLEEAEKIIAAVESKTK